MLYDCVVLDGSSGYTWLERLCRMDASLLVAVSRPRMDLVWALHGLAVSDAVDWLLRTISSYKLASSPTMARWLILHYVSPGMCKLDCNSVQDHLALSHTDNVNRDLLSIVNALVCGFHRLLLDGSSLSLRLALGC